MRKTYSIEVDCAACANKMELAAKKTECMIIGAAPVEEAVFQEFPPEKYFVICADAGFETAQRLGITATTLEGILTVKGQGRR